MNQIPITKRPLPTRGLEGTPDAWIQDKAQYDTQLWGCPNPCWIVDNKMYDLNQFAKIHPGGSSWITLTKGQDISQHFRSHHLNYELAKTTLDKYYIGDCPNPQQPRFTFEEDGLFETVRKRLVSRYRVKQLTNNSESVQRGIVLLIIWSVLMVLTGFYQSYLFAILTGFITVSLFGVAHNFIHQKPHPLRYCFSLTSFIPHQWQIMHCLSHHVYTNTLLDYELGAFQPITFYSRCQEKSSKFVRVAMETVLLFISVSNFALKIFIVPIKTRKLPRFSYLLPLSQILLLYLCSGSLYHSLLLFFVVQASFGFFFGKITLCGHRVPELWTQGAQEIREYGLHTAMATAQTNPHATGYISLIFYTGFNIHTVHHLFPTIDHEHLPKADQVLREVCKERGIKLFQNSMIECNRKIHKLYKEREPFVMKIDG